MLIVLLTKCQTVKENTYNMNDTINIQESINKLFVNSDTRNWQGVENQFASKVLLDYKSMTGNPAVEISPSDITSSWKTVLPGFTETHHQIGNFIVKVDGDRAHVFCYGTATHYLENKNGNVWTVVGSYDFDLKKVDSVWKITVMKFNYKYQEGNTQLVKQAIENAK